MENKNILEAIENKINTEDYHQADQLFKSIVVETLTKKSKLKYFFLLAKVYFELDKNDLVMPTLNKVFQKPSVFSEIDRAYLLAACLNMDEAQKKHGEEKTKLLYKAERYFDKIKSIENLNREEQRILYFQKAILELSLNRVAESIVCFENALAIHESTDDQCMLHSYLADAYRDTKHYEKAIEHYDLALEKTSPSEDRSIAFLSIDKARVLDTIGREYEANRIIFNVLNKFDNEKKREDHEIAMYCQGVLGYTYYSLKEYKTSLEHFNQALGLAKRIGRDTTHYLYESSTVYRALKDFDHAEKRAREALELTTDDDYIQLIYIELFRQYKYSDRYEKAVEMLRKLIEEYPDYEDLGWIYRMIGHMQSLLNKHGEAIEYFEKSLEVLDKDDEGRITALDFTAYCSLKLGNIDRAMDICLDIIGKYPDGPNLAWTHAVLARCYFEKGMKIQAQDEAEKAQQYKAPTSEVYSFADNVLEEILRDLGIK